LESLFLTNGVSLPTFFGFFVQLPVSPVLLALFF
jgi:hypothetical protein